MRQLPENWYVTCNDDSEPYIRAWLTSVGEVAEEYIYTLNSGYGIFGGRVDGKTNPKSYNSTCITLDQFKQLVLNEQPKSITQIKII